MTYLEEYNYLIQGRHVIAGYWMKKDFFLNGFTAIAIVGMALSACTDNEPDYGLGTE